MEFLAHRISSNVRVLEGALNRLFAYASLVGREIDLDMTQECLADILRASERKVTIDEILRKVADHYNLRMSDMLSARRARQVARPRQVAMFLAKTLTSQVAAGHRATLRRARPHHGDPRGAQDRGTAGDRQPDRRGRGVASADAGSLRTRTSAGAISARVRSEPRVFQATERVDRIVAVPRATPHEGVDHRPLHALGGGIGVDVGGHARRIVEQVRKAE